MTRFLTSGLLSLLIYSLWGCAATEIRDPRTGRIVFRTQADASNVTYTGPGYSFHADSLNHSNPTLAGGTAVAKGIQSGATLTTTLGAAISTSGIVK